MNFGDLQSSEGLVLLNNFLADKSYIEGYNPTQSDVVVFESVKKVPSSDFENALRWYKHIASFNDEERQQFEGQHHSVEQDEFTLFSDDDDDEENELRKQRLVDYTKKKAEEPIVVAKSEIVLDVKPWDDQTNMKELENNVRSIELDGLLWGPSRLVPLAYGIKFFQITCIVEDDKVGTDILEERITGFEDHIQSVDIAAFRKI